MKFIFRVHKHTQIEIDSWRKIGFTTITDNNFSEYGVISATANLNFMSPLNATLTAINLHSDKLSEIVEKVNERDSLYLYTQSKPNLILVPNNKGDSLTKSGADYYSTQILSFCNFYRYKYKQPFGDSNWSTYVALPCDKTVTRKEKKLIFKIQI